MTRDIGSEGTSGHIRAARGFWFGGGLALTVALGAVSACSSSKDAGAGGSGNGGAAPSGAGGEASIRGGAGGAGGACASGACAGGSGGVPSGGDAGANAGAGTAGVVGSAGSAGESAEAGAGGAAPECESGEEACQDLARVKCAAGAFVPNGAPCAYACKLGQCVGECTVGATYCDGQTLHRCGSDNQWVTFACDTECVVLSPAKCVECGDSDAVCPTGCARANDTDCGQYPANVTCPEIYLGNGRAAGPLPALTGNPAITLPGGGAPWVENSLQLFGVTISNHGVDDSPPTTLTAYWADPSTGYALLPARKIGTVPLTKVAGAVSFPPAEGMSHANVAWTPDATVLATNGGHVALVVVLANDSPPGGTCTQQLYDGAHVTTDPLSAVQDVQVVAPPP